MEGLKPSFIPVTFLLLALTSSGRCGFLGVYASTGSLNLGSVYRAHRQLPILDLLNWFVVFSYGILFSRSETT